MPIDVLRTGDLDQGAEVHHRHPVADVLDDAHVVGDEQVGQAQPPLEVAEQVQDLGLDADVEGADRLVADEQLRLEDERAGDPDPLPLAAGELVGVPPGVVRLEADQFHHAGHLVGPLLRRAEAVDAQPLADGRRDRRARVERGVRVLEHDLHPAPVALELVALEVGDVVPVEDDSAAGRLDEAEERAPDGRLAAAGLPDQAERLAAPDLEADVVDGLHVADLALEDAAAHREELRQVLDLDEGAVRAGAAVVTGPRLRRSGRPSRSW